jgi:hypothetical protein
MLWRSTMSNGITRSVLVIKDTQSNLIEEAIFILRQGNEDLKEKEKCPVRAKRDKEFLLKEAELIINNFLKENNKNLLPAQEPAYTKKHINKRLVTNILINSALIGSIALLIFVMTRFF